MRGRCQNLFIALFAVLILTGCSQGASPNQPPFKLPDPGQLPLPNITLTAATAVPTPASSAIKLLGYNYKLKDAPDGWKEGTVSLAFENMSDAVLGSVVIDITEAVVETQEGKEYVATLQYVEPNRADPVATRQIDFSTMPRVILPHFRWTRIGRLGETAGQYMLKFRAASASHPLRIVFPKLPDYKIELAAAAQPSLSFPGEPNAISAKPLSALAGHVMMDDPAGLLITLDGVATQSGQSVQMKFSVSNRDKLDSHGASVNLAVLAYFFPDGAVWGKSPGMGSSTIVVGPGQTAKKDLPLGDLFMDKKCNPNVYALVQEIEQPTLYKLGVCK